MNKVANVIFAYTPKNDDELELKVGDKIEIIGLEEEGWWRGKLKGKIGVFPTNFVKVETTSTITSPPQATIPNTGNNNNNNSHINSSNNNTNNNIAPSSNKFPSNLFGNKIRKENLSSNSLNSNSSNNNLTSMNGTTQQAENPTTQTSSTGPEDPTSSERRPKPIRGVGFGDIFALNGGTVNSSSSSIKREAKPLPSISTNSTTSVAELTERLNSTSGSTNNTLQKQIPKKPPPPAPVSRSDQAPALPPKPGAQFNSPIMQQQPHQHHQQPIRPLAQHHQAKWGGTQQVREQAEVIYAYEPTNDDELAMEVGDIIDVIDKNIEDAGWWKGELRGKIGVFPDNFVKLIEKKITQENNQHHTNNSSATSSHQTTTPNLFNTHLNNIIQNNNDDKIINKPVFAATPKDFGRELENNLQRNIHNSNNTAAALLSFKRNKLQQMANMHQSNENGREIPPLEHSTSLTTSASIGKLNHITANRAKGPNRRLPSSVLNKRMHSLDQIPSSVKKESPSKEPDVTVPNQAPLPSLPVSSKPNLPPEPKVSLPVEPKLGPSVDTKVALPTEPTIGLPVEPETELESTPKLMAKQKCDELSDAKDKLRQAVATSTTIERINTFNTQLNELRGEIKHLKQELQGYNDLKDTVELMKAELKACQKVTENQGKYIKALVKNLTEERKRYALMQEEIDRTLN